MTGIKSTLIGITLGLSITSASADTRWYKVDIDFISFEKFMREESRSIPEGKLDDRLYYLDLAGKVSILSNGESATQHVVLKPGYRFSVSKNAFNGAYGSSSLVLEEPPMNHVRFDLSDQYPEFNSKSFDFSVQVVFDRIEAILNRNINRDLEPEDFRGDWEPYFAHLAKLPRVLKYDGSNDSKGSAPETLSIEIKDVDKRCSDDREIQPSNGNRLRRTKKWFQEANDELRIGWSCELSHPMTGRLEIKR